MARAGFPSPTIGVSPEQGPPLAIPVGYFALGPLSILCAGVVLMVYGASPLAGPLMPRSVPLAHLGTLGLLAATMMGALYQMAPVIAGATVPAVRLAHGVHACFAVGVALLVAGLLGGAPRLSAVGGTLLAVAIVGFVIPVGWGLARTRTRTETVYGMRLAVLAFALVATAGVVFSATRAGATGAVERIPGEYAAWRLGHLLLGLLVWVGGLICAVSWKVLPMFYLAAPLPAWTRRVALGGIALSLVGIPAAALFGSGTDAVVLAALPAGVAVLGLIPVLEIHAIWNRGRKRVDYSAQSWMAGLACGLLTGVSGLVAVKTSQPRLDVLFAWLAIFGWAGLILHGMQSRILPFLVWFHRLAPWIGKVRVPAVRNILPQPRLRRSLLLHGSALVCGAVAIVAGSDLLARATGLLLAATAVSMCVAFGGVLLTPVPKPVPKPEPKES